MQQKEKYVLPITKRVDLMSDDDVVQDLFFQEYESILKFIYEMEIQKYKLLLEITEHPYINPTLTKLRILNVKALDNTIHQMKKAIKI